MNRSFRYIIFLLIGGMCWACRAKEDYPGMEFAPNMYHAVPYEPLKQITDEDAGSLVDSDNDPYGEYYSTNPYNPHGMNMRVPPANTVKRTATSRLPYRIPKDSIELAARIVKNPLESTEQVVARGKELYDVYCIACHGDTGQGDGPVGEVMKGLPAYNTGRVKDLNEGHIFHVITMGKGRMYPHASQIDPVDRWKIVRYVQTLQSQAN